MIDLTEQEQAAIRTVMRPVAEILKEIGWQTQLQDLSEPQVLTLIEAAVGGFRDAMHAKASQAVEAPRPLTAEDIPF